ncbi:MAG: TIM barrel protein [Gammaproteobacteria bacterium]|nr:TIM barrel protein [Gammaproteobacteria bacterium]
MPRFAANLTTMCRGQSLTAACAAVRALGFRAAEILFPYDHPVAEVHDALADAGLELLLVNTPPGDWSAGERGLAALPGREGDFEAAFAQALDYARGLGAPMIHVMAGVVPAGVPRAECADVFVANLRTAARQAQTQGVRLLLEPLNGRDVPGYLHATAAEARALIERIGAPNVGLQFDFYHLQITQGDLAAALAEHHDIIGHVQFSSVPGRHEPQYGEVNLPFLFERLDALGYAGWVGCEYTPKTGLEAGLAWGRAYGLGGLLAVSDTDAQVVDRGEPVVSDTARQVLDRVGEEREGRG